MDEFSPPEGAGRELEINDGERVGVNSPVRRFRNGFGPEANSAGRLRA
jgi:hypothetical protein